MADSPTSPTPPPEQPGARRQAPLLSQEGAAGREFERLIAIMRRLRSPDGCPWDREQTPRTLAPYVLEEAHEVVDAIERDDAEALCEELGDHVFEAVFLAQIHAEAGRFSMADALGAVNDKLIRRHPHVFAAERDPTVDSSERVLEQWERIKRQERAERVGGPASLLDGMPPSLPSLAAAHRIGSRVARVGFDWPDTTAVTEKVAEELAEVVEAIALGDADRVDEEVGDLLFAVANLARKAGVEPEGALRRANAKFARRFRGVEQRVATTGGDLAGLSAGDLDTHWRAVKSLERADAID